MHPARLCVVLAAALFALGSVACSADAGSNDEAASDEGELSLFGGKKIDVVVGKVVIVDAQLAMKVSTSDAAKKVVASPRDGELSGGLVMLAGADFEKLHFGLQCTVRDGTCVMRWMARTDSVSTPLAVRGDVAKAMSRVFDKDFDGTTPIVCSSSMCTLQLSENAAKGATFERLSVDESDAQKFGGF